MHCRIATLTLTAALLVSGTVLADKDTKKEESSFGALRGVDAAEARKQAEAWLKSVGKTDAASVAEAKKIWEGDKTLLDKVSTTLVLGDPAAGKLLAEARNADIAAPTEVPAILKDKSKPAFYRNNLALLYGRALAGKKVYEEALESLALAKVDDVVDPASYLFHRAVCEYELMLKDRADSSIDRLLVDVNDSPERYRMVAALMHFDMLTWQEKDLGWIARKMDNIQRRLDLKRGGKNTQKMQKEVLVRLDEMIKEIENKQKQQQQGSGPGNDGNCPDGGQPGPDAPGTDKSSNPQRDTQGGTAKGTGDVDKKKAKETAEVWGKLQEKDRAAAIRDLTRNMPAKDRAVIEAYLRELAKRSGK